MFWVFVCLFGVFFGAVTKILHVMRKKGWVGSSFLFVLFLGRVCEITSPPLRLCPEAGQNGNNRWCEYLMYSANTGQLQQIASLVPSAPSVIRAAPFAPASEKVGKEARNPWISPTPWVKSNLSPSEFLWIHNVCGHLSPEHWPFPSSLPFSPPWTFIFFDKWVLLQFWSLRMPSRAEQVCREPVPLALIFQNIKYQVLTPKEPAC